MSRMNEISVSQGTVSLHERAENINTLWIQRYAELYDVSVSYLLETIELPGEPVNTTPPETFPAVYDSVFGGKDYRQEALKRAHLLVEQIRKVADDDAGITIHAEICLDEDGDHLLSTIISDLRGIRVYLEAAMEVSDEEIYVLWRHIDNAYSMLTELIQKLEQKEGEKVS